MSVFVFVHLCICVFVFTWTNSSAVFKIMRAGEVVEHSNSYSWSYPPTPPSPFYKRNSHFKLLKSKFPNFTVVNCRLITFCQISAITVHPILSWYLLLNSPTVLLRSLLEFDQWVYSINYDGVGELSHKCYAVFQFQFNLSLSCSTLLVDNYTWVALHSFWSRLCH